MLRVYLSRVGYSSSVCFGGLQILLLLHHLALLVCALILIPRQLLLRQVRLLARYKTSWQLIRWEQPSKLLKLLATTWSTTRTCSLARNSGTARALSQLFLLLLHLKQGLLLGFLHASDCIIA